MADNPAQNDIPDGGWGWMVVAGAAIINITNQSVVSVFGLLFGEHLHKIYEGTTGAALVTNLNSLALNFSGLLIGPAMKYFSPRQVALLGCAMCSCGLILCAVSSTQLWHMIVFYSVMVGIGLGLNAPSTFLAINSYFKEKRGRAIGIAMAGGGLGQMLMPFVVRICLEEYGFRITVLIVGALALLGLIGASFFRPVEALRKRPGHKNMKQLKLLVNLKDEHEEKEKTEICEIKISNETEEPREEKQNSLKLNKNVKSMKTLLKRSFHRITMPMDLELLKDLRFLSIIIGIGLAYTATSNFSMLFPYVLQNSVGLSRSDTAFCMSILAAADLISRLLLPIFTDRHKISYRVVFLTGVIGMLISRAVLAELSDYYHIVIMSAFCGATKAATILNNNLTIAQHCEPQKLPGGLGLNMISKGVLVISIGQLLGWFRDFTGSYSWCLHAQNFLLLIVMLVWIPELCLYAFFKKKKAQNTAVLIMDNCT